MRRHYMGKMDTKEGITASLEFIPALQIGVERFEVIGVLQSSTERLSLGAAS